MGGWNVNIGGGLFTAEDHSQRELRAMPPAKDAAKLFKALLKRELWPFVGKIKKVFGPPKSVGLHFKFAAGMRDEFVRVVDPQWISKRMGFMPNLEKSNSPLVPDDMGCSDPNRLFRRQAARAGLGTSFRQEGTKQSLHVAYDDSECDVHVDRNGFIVRHGDGSVHWNLNGMIRHLTVDLIPDKVPALALSVNYRDKYDSPVFSATLAPWVAVDLPSPTSKSMGVTIGLFAKGTHNLF